MAHVTLSLSSRLASASAADSVKAAVTAAATKIKEVAVRVLATLSFYGTLMAQAAKHYAAKGLTATTTFVANNPVALKALGLVGAGAAAGALVMKYFTPKPVVETDLEAATRVHVRLAAAAEAAATALAAVPAGADHDTARAAATAASTSAIAARDAAKALVDQLTPAVV